MTTIPMFLRGVRRSVPALAFLVATAACATETSTTSEWSSQVPASGPVKQVVVFGAGLDHSQRRVLEDQLSMSLSEHGVTAKPSYALFADSVPDRDAAHAALDSGGYDGALVAKLKKVRETPRYVPTGDGFWGGYYGAGWDSGYYTTDTNVNFEVTLWDTRGKGKMLWSSTTTTLNPINSKDFADSLAKNVMPNLEKGGFLPH